jgi:hypothetical protein
MHRQPLLRYSHEHRRSGHESTSLHCSHGYRYAPTGLPQASGALIRMLALYPAPVLPKRCEHKPFPRVKSSPLPTPYNTHYTIEVPALQCGTVQPNFIPNAVGSIQQHHTLACTRDKIHIVREKT